MTLAEAATRFLEQPINAMPKISTNANDLLPKPLSELGDINPIPKIQEYVRRSEQQRHEEAREHLKHQSRRGLKLQAVIKRPINCFMLYMKAWATYASRRFRNTDLTALEIVALSWRKETSEMKEIYKRLADEEKINHRIAHKDYQYNPSSRKPQQVESAANFQYQPSRPLLSNGVKQAKQQQSALPEYDFVLFDDYLPSPEDIYGSEESFPWAPLAELPATPHSCEYCYYNLPNTDTFIPMFSPVMTTI